MDFSSSQEIFNHNGLDIYLSHDHRCLKLQAFDHSLSRLFQMEVDDDSIVLQMTKNFCKSKEEFFKVLVQGFGNHPNKSIICTLDKSGMLHYQCSIQFPLEKIISFDIQLHNIELTELKHAELHISSLKYQISVIERQLVKEQFYGDIKENELISPSFSNTFNAKSFIFNNDNKTIVRNSFNSGQYTTIWGDKFLKRYGKQAFDVKIEDINQNFNYSYAIVGVNKIDYMGENIYKGKGCYNLMKERVFFDRSEFQIGAVFFKGDIIRVVVDFDKLEVIWLQNGDRVTSVKFIKDEENFDLYPVISLKYENECVSFI